MTCIKHVILISASGIRNTLKRVLPAVVPALCIGFVCIACGILISLGGPILGLILAGMAIGLGAFFIPLSWVFWLLIFTTFLFAGPIQYFGNINKIFWAPYLLGLLFLMRVLAERLFRQHDDTEYAVERIPAFGVMFMLSLYIMTLLAASAFNEAPFLQVLLSLKEYFFLLGVGFSIAWGLIRPGVIDRLFSFSHWYLLVQLPVIVYQHFVIAAKRLGTSPWDAVVGLMSGNQNGGGASAAMALCVVLIMSYHLSAWRAGLCKLPKLLLVFVVGMASIMLAEVKFVILLIPLAFALVYLKDILRRPLMGFFILLCSVFLAGLVLFAYQAQFSGRLTKSSVSIRGYVEETVERNTGEDQVNMETGEMGRVAAFKFWQDQHSLSDPLHLLLGHGIGSSRIGLVYGEVAQRFRFELGRSSLVVFLWEGGVLTAISISLVLWFGILAGFRRARSSFVTQDRTVCQTAAIGLVLTLAMTPYGPDLIFVSQAQLLAILLLGRIYAPQPLSKGCT